MMFPETQILIEERLSSVYGFKRKPSAKGFTLRGRCPDCGHKEASAWAHAEEPWVIFCPRKNECGHENHVRDLFPDLFEKWEKRFEPTPEDPLRTVNAYLQESRGFPLEALKGLYSQENRVKYNPKMSTITLRFPITDEEGNEGWWERVLDEQGVFNKTYFKEKWSSSGHAWTTPNTNYIDSKEIFITEGIFDTIALWLSDITSFSQLSAGNYPSIFLNHIAEKCAEQEKPLPKLVWALDNDPAGHAGILKNIEKATADGFECTAALPPFGRKKQDWNDLYKQDRLKFSDIENYKYYGALITAENAVDKGILIYKHKGMKSFPFDFNNQVYWFKLDMDKYDDYMKGLHGTDNNDDWAQEEKDLLIAERRDSALEHASSVEIMMECRPHGLYYQYQKEIDEAEYYFKVDFPRGGQSIKNTFTSSQITSAGPFGDRLTHIAPGVFYEGNSKQLIAFLKRELRDIRRVELINYVGYHKEHKTYVLGDVAVQNGRRFDINKEDFFELPRKTNLKARAPFQLDINSNLGDYTHSWVTDLLDSYDVRGMVALTAFFGSLFAQQIRSMDKSFPFVELVGEPGTGKSTLLVFLWKLLGRSGYEGTDPVKSSMAGLLRSFRQVSNLPMVLLESDREGDKGVVKQFDWNALKTLYDNGSLGAKGVKNGGNETYEPPFMGTLVISQNAEIVSTEAVMGRIVQYKFTKEQMSKKGLYASRRLEKYEQSEISQFILLCVEKEQAILESYRLGMQKYDEFLHHEKFGIKSSRVIHNHAQIMSLFDALCMHVLIEKDTQGTVKSLISIDMQKKVHGELLEMAMNRDKVLKSDPIIVQNFWATVEEMEDAIKLPDHKESNVNHHAKSQQFVAINFAQLYQLAANYRYSLPDLNELQHALRHSIHYRFIEANKMVASKIDGKSKRCWVFEKPTSQRD